MLSEYSAQNLEQLVSKITQYGFCQMENFLSQDDIAELANEIWLLSETELMHAAGTGRASVITANKIRGDSIYWLDKNNTSQVQNAYFDKMEILRLSLNEHLYLGLFDLECHLALYPTGSGYKKHIDQFATTINNEKPKRQISCVLYLNNNWLEADGGQLRLYLNSESDAISNSIEHLKFIDIAPNGGRLVVFLSDTFYHEVLPATRDRMSLSGWFLSR